MVEMKAVLSTLMQQFIFEEVPGFTVKPIIRLTTKPDPPLRLKIRKLTSWHKTDFSLACLKFC